MLILLLTAVLNAQEISTSTVVTSTTPPKVEYRVIRGEVFGVKISSPTSEIYVKGITRGKKVEVTLKVTKRTRIKRLKEKITISDITPPEKIVALYKKGENIAIFIRLIKKKELEEK